MSEKKLRLARAKEEYAHCKLEFAAAQIDVIEAEEPETFDKGTQANSLLRQQNYSQTEEHTKKEQITKETQSDEVSHIQEVQRSTSTSIVNSTILRSRPKSTTLEERRNYISECVDNIRKLKYNQKTLIFQGAEDSDSNLVKRLQNWPQLNNSIESFYNFAVEVGKLEFSWEDDNEDTPLFHNLLLKLPEHLRSSYFDCTLNRINKDKGMTYLNLFIEYCSKLADMCLPYIPNEEERCYLLPDPSGGYLYHSGDSWNGVGWVDGICELLFLDQIIASEKSGSGTSGGAESINKETNDFLSNNQLFLKVMGQTEHYLMEHTNFTIHVLDSMVSELQDKWISPSQGRILVLVYLDRVPWTLRMSYLIYAFVNKTSNKSESEVFIEYIKSNKNDISEKLILTSLSGQSELFYCRENTIESIETDCIESDE